jgi:hypothetical protein
MMSRTSSSLFMDFFVSLLRNNVVISYSSLPSKTLIVDVCCRKGGEEIDL